MANEIALTDSDLPVDVLNWIEAEYISLVAGEQMLQGAVVRIGTASDTTKAGYAVNGNASTNAEAAAIGINKKKVGDRGNVDVIIKGVVQNFDLGDLDYWAPIYISDTDGRLSSVPGTVRRIVGRVIPIDTGKVGVAPDKALYLDFRDALFADPSSNAAMGNTLVSVDADTQAWLRAAQAALIAAGIIVDA